MPSQEWQPPYSKIIQSYLIKNKHRWVNLTELRKELGIGQRTVHHACQLLLEDNEIEMIRGGPGPKPAQYKYKE